MYKTDCRDRQVRNGRAAQTLTLEPETRRFRGTFDGGGDGGGGRARHREMIFKDFSRIRRCRCRDVFQMSVVNFCGLPKFFMTTD